MNENMKRMARIQEDYLLKQYELLASIAPGGWVDRQGNAVKRRGVEMFNPIRPIYVPYEENFYGVGLYEIIFGERERQLKRREWRGRCVETAVVLLLLGIALMIVTGGL